MGGLVDWWIGGLVDWRLVDWRLVNWRLVNWLIGGFGDWLIGSIEGGYRKS